MAANNVTNNLILISEERMLKTVCQGIRQSATNRDNGFHTIKTQINGLCLPKPPLTSRACDSPWPQIFGTSRGEIFPGTRVDGDSFHKVKEELILQKTSLKAEKERLQRKRINSWIEPTRGVINTLETLDNMAAAASPHELAKTLRKIGTNPLISNKTVTFSFGEDYVFLPSLLAGARYAPNVHSAKRRGDLDQSLKWCLGPDSNRKPID